MAEGFHIIHFLITLVLAGLWLGARGRNDRLVNENRLLRAHLKGAKTELARAGISMTGGYWDD